jgi:glyoxylase-like metal-dependent hydrolase (beta-lactamase superfamily II)
MLASERDAAVARRTWLDRQRYRPQQWSTQQHWRVHEPSASEKWHGFACVQPIPSLDVALVPLIGHTLGHAGVAVRLERRWLLDAGDAYFYYAEMDTDRPRCTPGLKFYQWMMEKRRDERLANQRRLRELVVAQRSSVDVFCSHDMTEFERFAGVSPELPATLAPAR